MFNAITAAGTFDHFHSGHQVFLLEAFRLAKVVYLGITSDEFVQATKPQEVIQPFSTRKKIVEEFLASHHLLDRASIFELTNHFGPAIEKECPFEAILTTPDTLPTAQRINQKRVESGLLELEIKTINLLFSPDGKIVSATRIRQGEIDRSGETYIAQHFLSQTAQLPQTLREKLKTPFGKIYEGSEENYLEAIEKIKRTNPKPPLITVGDIVTTSFNQAKIPITLAIIDLKTKRKTIYSSITELGFAPDTHVIQVENSAGSLSGELTTTIIQAIQSKRPETIIQISGEEDLATILAVLAAPLGSLIYYGQTGKGVVEILVTEETKQQFKEILTQFTLL